MVAETKTITQRLTDGFKDYYTNIMSFDAIYVGGQLFLHGEAKAIDIGLPTTFGGDVKVKTNYMLNWFSTLWLKHYTELQTTQIKYKDYDVYKDSKIQLMGMVKKPVSVTRYVSILIKCVEAITVMRAKHGLINKQKERIKELVNLLPDNFNVKVEPVYDVIGHLIEEVDLVHDRLRKDYTGRDLYPSATFTLLTSTDQLKNMLTSLVNDRVYELLTVNNQNLYHPTAKQLVKGCFGNVTQNDIDQYHLPELLVLILKTLALMNECVDLCLTLVDTCESAINNLSEPNETI